MIDRLLKLYLKLTRKEYLVPFIEGLVNLGQPSTVTFPVELLEQGLGIVLSGLNNTMAAQTNLAWVWPYWLERQQDPTDSSFLPTGVNLLCANLTHRNWTSLGVVDSSRESMVDPVGMLTPMPFGWSVFPYVRLEQQLHLPPRMRERLRQSLAEQVMPCVVTEYFAHPQLEWSSRAMAFMEHGEELISFSHHLRNTGGEPLALTFGLALRPYNPLTLGHINKLKYKNRLWRVNRKPGLLMLEDPQRVFISDRHLGDPLNLPAALVQSTNSSSRSGILAGCWELDLVLEPGQARKIESLATLARHKQYPKIKFRGLNLTSVERARARTFTEWHQQSERGTLVKLPDIHLERAYQAVRNHLHVFDDVTHFSPGTFFYHGHWFRDSAFIALGFENAGFGDRVTKKLELFVEKQTLDGFFRSQNGEWDSNGQAIWTIVNHARRHGDLDTLRRLYPALRKGAIWLETQCRKTLGAPVPHAGLLPPGISAEHFGPNDHYFWDNFWGIAGLKSTLWAAQRLDRKADATRFWNQLEDYRHRLDDAIIGALARTQGDVLPTSPYRNPDNAAIGNLVAVTPLDLFRPEVPWFRPTVEFLMSHNLLHGLFFQKIIHTGLNAYLSVQLARALLALGDPRWFEILEALMRFGGPTYSWPEAIHPRSNGGCMGDGDHGWAAAEFISLVREMLVREQGGELHLAAGVPGRWLAEEAELSLTRATTLAGTLSYRLWRERDRLRLLWELKPNPLSEPMPLYFYLPEGFSAAKVKHAHNGAPKVHLPELSGELVFPSKDSENHANKYRARKISTGVAS